MTGRLPVSLALLLAACSPDVSGRVVDVGSGEPVAGATVEILSHGWGRRDGQLVWDKEYVHSDVSDAAGSFTIETDGGVRLRATAPGHAAVESSLCSRSPMLVRIGGPFGEITPRKMVRLDAGGSRGWSFAGSRSVAAENADLIAEGEPDDEKTLTLRAPLGFAFVPGTGAPPPIPTDGYSTELEIGLFDCGWLFVRTRGGGTAAVKTGSFGTEEVNGEAKMLLLPYAELPAG